MNVGSLFAGIGGFDLGLERAGMRTIWQVEQEEFRRRVLARHFPDAQRFEDVRDVGVHNLASVDVICGGFPCQDLSLAGKGAGIDGARSGLWSEYARIVGELRPRYVIVENVPALLGRGMGRVLGDLAALGYDAEWDCLPASAFGAPHRRDRIWLLAYPGWERDESGRGSNDLLRMAGSTQGEGLQRQRSGRAVGSSGSGGRRLARGTSPDPHGGRFPVGGEQDRGTHEPGQPTPRRDDADGLRPPLADPDSEIGGAAGSSGEAVERPGRRGSGEGSPWTTEPDVGRVADGVPARVDRLAALGDALVPQIAEWIGNRILSYEQAVNEQAA